LDIEDKVLLLAILKKEADEKLEDILMMLENSRVFTLKEGKKRARRLREEGYLQDGELTFKGEVAAKGAEAEFKLP